MVVAHSAHVPQDGRPRLDEIGFTPRQVADQLGHVNPSMTLDIYFGRQG